MMNVLKKNGTTSGETVMKVVEKGRPLVTRLKYVYTVADSLIKGSAPKAKAKAKAQGKAVAVPDP